MNPNNIRKPMASSFRSPRELLFDSLFQFNPDMIFILDSKGNISNLNPAGEKILKCSARELAGKPCSSLISPDFLEIAQEQFHKVLQGTAVSLEIPFVNIENRRIECSVTAFPFFVGRSISGVIGIAKDITFQRITERKLIESEQRYKSLFDHNIDAVLTFDLEGHFLYVNKATEALTGYNADELLGMSFLPLIHPDKKEMTLEHFNTARQGKSHHYETSIYTKQGNLLDFHVTLTPIIIDNRIEGIHCIGKDITDIKRSHEKVNYMAYHDHLTGLPNQRLFQDRCNQALMRANRNQSIVSILVLDLDRFKSVNDSLGHDMGDLLLQYVSGRLVECVGNTENVFRYGGDEFTILVENSSQEESSLLAAAIIDALSKPYDLDGFEVVVTPSIGISQYPVHGEDAKTLFKKADNSMFHAKRLGESSFQVYNDSIPNFTNDTFQIETLLRKAIERRELILHYQPQVDLKSNSVKGIEALVRWDSRQLGMVPPGKFIPIAEESGLIVPIGEWVLRTACSQNKAWQDAGLPPMVVSVNLSARQFYQSNLAHQVSSILQEVGLDPQYLELEITESMTVQVESAATTLQELKKIGVKITIDDFGTGYSSLNYLKKLPIDRLKIDQSFVRDLLTDPNDRDIVATIIVMGHSLKKQIIAEGVETQEQLDFLREKHCDEIQGYFFSKPVDSKSIPKIIEQINSYLHTNR